MQFTNMIATVGPSCKTPEILDELMESGVGIFRFNFSHGTYASQQESIEMVRAAAEKRNHRAAILLDTKGPEIRTADLKDPAELEKDGEVILTVEHGTYEENGKIQVNYDDFVGDVSVGDKILIDNGTINFLVESKTETDVVCKILDGGTLKSRRHINLPGVDPSLATITKKDWEDIAFGVKQGVDFIALSFVRSSAAVEELRDYLKKEGAEHIKIIAKIESYEATQNLEGIIRSADGAMVARGDLGAEVPFAQVPALQQEIVRLSIFYRKPVIVATHMLESMIEHPIPTRAEVNDIALAVWQRADCIMMSGETASGKYPIKSAQAMGSVVREIEKDFAFQETHLEVEVESDKVNFAQMAAQMVKDADDLACIVVISRSGNMARNVAAFRPALPIVVCTSGDAISRQMEMVWGCHGITIEFDSEVPEHTVIMAETAILKEQKNLQGSKYLLVSEFKEGERFVPTLQVRTLDGV